MAARARRDDSGPVIDGVLPGRLSVGLGFDTVRPRGVPEWLIMLTVGGRGRLRPATSGDWIELPPRSIVAYRPQVPQEYGTAPSPGTWDVLWMHVHPRADWLPLLEWAPCAPGIGRLDLSAVIAERVQVALTRAVAHHLTGLGQSRALAMNAVEEGLLWSGSENPLGGRTDTAVLAVLEHLGTHLGAPHSLTSLAAVAGVSPSHLGRAVKEATGLSVMAVVERMRMDAARELLDHTGLTAAQVAARVGYPDPLYFSRRFRRDSGLPPRAWRRRTER
jgi:AraC family transcriptional regulator of arabinose operon